MEELANRVIAAGWRWTRGTVEMGGAVVAGVYGAGKYVTWADGDHVSDLEEPDGAVPDMENAGNIGHLLALVREKHGDVFVLPKHALGMDSDGWSVRRMEGFATRFIGAGETEVEALVAALEASA